jgi:hypothetical protein
VIARGDDAAPEVTVNTSRLHPARRALAVTALLVSVAALGACADSPSPGGSPSPPDSSSPSASASPSPSPSALADVELYFAVAHPTELDLVAELHDINDASDPLETALAGLIDGSLAPLDPDYRSLWTGATLVSIERDGDVLRVDLSGPLTNVGAEAEGVAIEQLVWTATSIEPSIRALVFTIDGATPETLGGHVDARGEFVRGLPESTLTPVQIDTPAEAASVSSPLRATGVACVFEATFGWELLQGGTVIEEGFAMSAESCPARAPWSLDLGPRPAGEYTLVITEYSMKDGSVAATDSKTFTVTGE